MGRGDLSCFCLFFFWSKSASYLHLLQSKEGECFVASSLKAKSVKIASFFKHKRAEVK